MDENDEVLISGFGRRGKAKGDIPGVRFKIVKVSGVGLLALWKEKKVRLFVFSLPLFPLFFLGSKTCLVYAMPSFVEDWSPLVPSKLHISPRGRALARERLASDRIPNMLGSPLLPFIVSLIFIEAYNALHPWITELVTDKRLFSIYLGEATLLSLLAARQTGLGGKMASPILLARRVYITVQYKPVALSIWRSWPVCLPSFLSPLLFHRLTSLHSPRLPSSSSSFISAILPKFLLLSVCGP